MRTVFRTGVFIGGLAICGLGLSSCANARFIVHDQGTGVAVIQARAVEVRSAGAGGEILLADADDHGRMAVRLPANDDAIVAVRADGFVQYSKTAGWLRAQPQPLSIPLAPLWLSEFLRTGKKPSEIITVKPCHCPAAQVR